MKTDEDKIVAEKKYGKQELKAIRSKQALLDAAAALFREKKIADVGVREISAAAGVTTGTFYHYFESKDDILDALYQKRDQQFEVIFEELYAKPPYTDGIVRFFEENLSALVETDGIDFTMHRMFVMRKKSDPDMNLTKGMEKLIELAKKNGEIAPAYDSKETAEFFFMLFRGVVYDWCITEENKRQSLKKMERKAMQCAVRAFER